MDVDHIDFLVDGQVVAGAVGRGQPSTAIYGTTRPDVAAAFPDVPTGALLAASSANIDTSQFINGIHNVSVRATDNEGATREIGTRTIQVVNNGSNLAPFGQIDFPLDKASLFCTTIDGGIPSPCYAGRLLLVLSSTSWPDGRSTWARALDRGQVSFVELLLDGRSSRTPARDCTQVGRRLTNCYGINRPDVARSYSGYVNADNAGIRASRSGLERRRRRAA